MYKFIDFLEDDSKRELGVLVDNIRKVADEIEKQIKKEMDV